MITEWFMNLSAGFVAWLVATFPAWDVPAWFLTVDDGVNSVVVMAGSMGAWVDIVLALSIVSVVISTWVVSIVIKLALRAGSHLPGIGGAG